jgi:hypothetical protein
LAVACELSRYFSSAFWFGNCDRSSSFASS